MTLVFGKKKRFYCDRTDELSSTLYLYFVARGGISLAPSAEPHLSSQLLDAALITSSRPVAHQEFGLGPRGSQLQELSTCDSAEVCHHQDLLSAFVLSKGLRCFLQLLADIFCSWYGFLTTTTANNIP